MNKVSDVFAERFSQGLLETFFCKQCPPGDWIVKLPIYDFVKTFQNQKVFKPIATGKVKDENINFEPYRTSSMSKKYKQNNPGYLQEFQAAIIYLTIIQSNLCITTTWGMKFLWSL